MFRLKIKVLFLSAVFAFSFCSAKVPVTCPPICEKLCQSGFKRYFNGCEYCECEDPCEKTSCGMGEYCVRKEVQCVMAPCYDIAECVSCDPVCALFCASGMRKDAKGCPTCQCVDPCEYKNCKEGEYCERESPDCKKNPCYDEGICVSCSGVCKMLCESGFRSDINNCPICQCVDPCERYTCPRGKTCQRNKVQCFAHPCYDVAECVCPLYKCQACDFGYVIDENGCQTCQCQDPCVAILCHISKPYCYNGICHKKPERIRY